MGILTNHSAGQTFIDRVRKETLPDTRYIVLNFNESSLPDSRFIGKLIELYHEYKRSGIKMYLLGSKNEDITDLFKVAYLDRLMPFIKSEDDIVA